MKTPTPRGGRENNSTDNANRRGEGYNHGAARLYHYLEAR